MVKKEEAMNLGRKEKRHGVVKLLLDNALFHCNDFSFTRDVTQRTPPPEKKKEGKKDKKIE